MADEQKHEAEAARRTLAGDLADAHRVQEDLRAQVRSLDGEARKVPHLEQEIERNKEQEKSLRGRLSKAYEGNDRLSDDVARLEREREEARDKLLISKQRALELERKLEGSAKTIDRNARLEEANRRLVGEKDALEKEVERLREVEKRAKLDIETRDALREVL